MKNFDVIIIGGGASGCFCALNLKKDLKVAIVDGGQFLAKKLLVTGNGRCNLTNVNYFNCCYNTDLDDFLLKFSSEDTIKFFNNLGLMTYADEQGRVYPVSNSAKSVVDVLNFHITNNKNIFVVNENAINIKKQESLFFVQTDNQTLCANKVVVATGGNTHNLLQNFDLEITKNIPALVALKTKQKSDRLEGVKVTNVKVSCNVNGKTFSENGEVLFKKNGLSGICVFNLSCHFARSGAFNGKVFINLLPEYSYNDLIAILKNNFNIFDNCLNALSGLFHKQLCIELLYRSGLNATDNCKNIDSKKINEIANNIFKMEFDVVDCFENNQIYCGGISLNCLDKNLQCKNYNGLYFCGEVVNVDGLCGGYNLQWAWTSGYIVAKSLGENL